MDQAKRARWEIRSHVGSSSVQVLPLEGMELSQTIQTGVCPTELGSDWCPNGGFKVAPRNGPAPKRDANALFNARSASLLLEGMGLRITGRSRNLADKRYAATSLAVET